MTNVLKLTKKIFTVGVVATTIVWSLGVAALVPTVANAATCPTLAAGDMVKVTGKPAIYAVDNNLKVRYFDNGDVFKSWRPTYGGYISISMDCLDSLGIPSVAPYGVAYHSGSYIVKRASSDQLYVVEPTNTLAKITSALATTLYGTGYKVMTITDQDWPNYPNRGTDVTEAKAHAGMLVKNGAKTYYVNTDLKLQEVSETGMTANGFQTKFVRTVADSVVSGLAGGDAITAEVKALTDKTQSGGVTGGVVIPVSGAVSVSLSADTPASALMAANTAFNTVLKFNVSAASGDVVMTGVKVKKYGYAANAAVNGLALFNAAGTQLGNTVNSLTADAEADVLFSGTPYTVHAGTTETFTLKVHAGNVTTGDLKLAVTGVTASGNPSVAGLPVTGNTFTMTDGSNSVFSATLELMGDYATSVNLDTKGQDALKVRVNVTNSTEDVKVEKIVLYNAGTAADTDFGNVALYNKSGDKIATAEPKDRYVTFDLSANPVVVTKGQNHTFNVKLDVKTGASRNVRLTIQENDDVMLKGVSTGAYVLATGAGSVDTTFPLGNAVNLLSIASGTLSVSEKGSLTSNVASGETSVLLGKFALKPAGEAMELRKMKVVLIQGGPVALSGTVYVKVNGSTVYSVAASSLTTSTQALISTALTNDTEKTMSTYYSMPADTDAVVEVFGDVSSLATASDSYGAGIDAYEVKRVSTNDIFATATANVNSTARAVSAASMTITNINWLAGTYNVVKGDNNVTLAKFTMDTRSSGENVRVNSLVFSDTTGVTAAITDITNLKIYEDGVVEPIATSNNVNAITATSTVTFTFSQPIVLVKGSAVRTFYLKADVSSGAAGDATDTHKFAIKSDNSSDAVGVDTASSADAVAGTAQTVTISAGGSLQVAVSYNSGHTYSENGTVTIGSTNQEFTVFKFTAYDENIKVTDLTLEATGTLKYTDFTNVRLYKNDEVAPFASAAQFAGADAVGKTYTYSSSDALFEVPAGQTVYIRVKADISTDSGAKLGDTLRFQITDVDTIVAKGKTTLAAGQKSGTATLSYYKQIVPFGVSISGVTPTEGSSQTVNVGANTILGQFKVVNNGSAAITMFSTTATGTIYDGGTNSSTSLIYDLYASNANSTAPITKIATSAKASNALTFAGDVVAGGTTIQPGQYITFTVKAGSTGATGLVAGDTFQLYVSAIGNVTFNVTDDALGYDGAVDGSTNTTNAGLFLLGKPQLGTYIKT